MLKESAAIVGHRSEGQSSKCAGKPTTPLTLPPLCGASSDKQRHKQQNHGYPPSSLASPSRRPLLMPCRREQGLKSSESLPMLPSRGQSSKCSKESGSDAGLKPSSPPAWSDMDFLRAGNRAQQC